MINPDPEARTDPRFLLTQRAARGAERARQSRRRLRRVGTVAVLGLALLAVPFAARSWAWTLAISGEGVCNTRTGNYDLTWTLDNTSEPEAASVTGDLTATVPAHGTKTVTESVPGTTSGSVSRTVRINWPSDQANLKRTATVRLAGDCEKPPPPPPPPPPAKQGSAGVTTTCDSVTFNFSGADEGIKQYAKVDGKTKSPASRNGSVTFDNLAPGEHPVEYGSGSNVERGSFEAQDCTPAEPKKDDTIAGTATDQTREEDTPTVTTTPKPGQLPFTGPQDLLLPVGSLLVFTGALLLVANSRRRYRMLPVAVRAVERALRKPYTGPRERL